MTDNLHSLICIHALAGQTVDILELINAETNDE